MDEILHGLSSPLIETDYRMILVFEPHHLLPAKNSLKESVYLTIKK